MKTHNNGIEIQRIVRVRETIKNNITKWEVLRDHFGKANTKYGAEYIKARKRKNRDQAELYKIKRDESRKEITACNTRIKCLKRRANRLTKRMQELHHETNRE